MKKVKLPIKCLAVLTALVMLAGLTACDKRKSDGKAAKKVLTAYFTAYEKADYEAMKPYCSDEFVETYFHEGDVFGNEWAKLLECSLDGRETEDSTLIFNVKVTEKPVEGSAFYDPDEPEQTDFLFYIMEKEADGKWRVTGLDRE